MQLADLTKATTLVGETSDYSKLAEHLGAVLNGESRCFTHMEPIYGADRSGRMLYQQPHGKAVRLNAPMTAGNVSIEFGRLIEVARYRPQDHALQHKGWEVSYATIDNRRVAIVWAKWVEPELLYPELVKK